MSFIMTTQLYIIVQFNLNKLYTGNYHEFGGYEDKHDNISTHQIMSHTIPKFHPKYSGKAMHTRLIWPDFMKHFNVGTILSLSQTRWLSSTNFYKGVHPYICNTSS